MGPRTRKTGTHVTVSVPWSFELMTLHPELQRLAP